MPGQGRRHARRPEAHGRASTSSLGPPICRFLPWHLHPHPGRADHHSTYAFCRRPTSLQLPRSMHCHLINTCAAFHSWWTDLLTRPLVSQVRVEGWIRDWQRGDPRRGA